MADHRSLTLSAGVRLDHYAFEDYQGQSFDDTGVSPNVMLTWTVVEPVSVHLRYAQAFRGVTDIDTITRTEGGTVNSPNMTGERAHNIDGGVRYDDGRWFAGTTLFRQEIDDVIGTVAGVRDNAGELTSSGYSVEAGLRLGGFTGRLGVDEAFPELNGAPLTDTDFGHGTAMGRAWSARLDYAFTAWRVNVGLVVRHVAAFDDVPAGIPGKDSYVVTDLYADWRPLKNHDLTLQVALNNLFDEYYVDQATTGYNAQLARVAGLPEPGFGVRLGASYKF